MVLVHGSGPNDRDETIGANKPFRDLAWGLATRSIAVLRYEKRTKQYPGKLMATGVGQFTAQEESIDDALSAVGQLRGTEGIDPKRIFVLGHSLGGTLAPRIGQADPKITGLIIMAGSTRPLEDMVVEQTRYLISLNGTPTAEGEAKLSEVQLIAAKVWPIWRSRRCRMSWGWARRRAERARIGQRMLALAHSRRRWFTKRRCIGWENGRKRMIGFAHAEWRHECSALEISQNTRNMVRQAIARRAYHIFVGPWHTVGVDAARGTAQAKGNMHGYEYDRHQAGPQALARARIPAGMGRW